MTRRRSSVVLLLTLAAIVVGTEAQAARRPLFRRLRARRCTCNSTSTKSAATTNKTKWTPLFDGNQLGQWKSTKFGGEGDVTIKGKSIHMAFGNSLSGITYNGKLPTTNYEIRLEAQKVDGIDFFCGLTFPVAKSHCTFVVGGWAGGVVGLSSIDGFDASENETTKYMVFKKGVWYKIRVRVEPNRIRTWIDDKMIVDVDIKDLKSDPRPEVDLSKPLGISAYETKAALRNIEIRPLTKADKK